MARVARLDINSKFQIDLRRWESDGRDFRTELKDALCAACREQYPEGYGPDVDRVDPVTGQVAKIDAAWECLIGVCAEQPTFIPITMPITRAIFRALLAEGNRPLSAKEIHQRIRKSTPEAVLQELKFKSGVEYNIVSVE